MTEKKKVSQKVEDTKKTVKKTDKAEKKVSKLAPKAEAKKSVVKSVEAKAEKKASKPVVATKKSDVKTTKVATANYIVIRQIKSAAGRVKAQHQTLVGLALGKVNKVSELQDTPSVRGMINKVKHLVEIVRG